MKKEPKILSRGKDFHKKIQLNWEINAEGTISTEKQIKKPSGKMGKIDVCVNSDEKLTAVVELKNSDWDKMKIEAVKRNVNCQARQIWDYIDSQLIKGKEVSPGVVFSKSPKNYNRLKLIEKIFNKQGISVIWEDESIEERKRRS